MSDKLITLAKILCVIVGISFSLMLVAICFSTAWRVLTLSWLVGEGDMNRVLCVVIIVLLVACGVLSLGLNHYRDNAITYKAQRDKKASELKLANVTITDMQVRQRDVAALDARYSRELADARAENETLRADVAAGRKRLRINANCPGSLRKAPITSGVDNATGPRLAEAAERDYFILRERLMAMQKQLEGAQEYIRTQCIP